MKNKAASSNAIHQAELILHLYELRRETVMREARSYVGGEFLPASRERIRRDRLRGRQAHGLRASGLRVLGYGRCFRGARRSRRYARL